MTFSLGVGSPATTTSEGSTAAQVEHHLRCELETRQHERGVNTAFEAIARVGVDSELPSGLGDIEFVPQRRFDQDVSG